nr:uncharacterized protein LOC125419570 [Ziziphus jujuba var. spinosa]
MELLKDYDCTFDYHMGKANVVADALSRKSTDCLFEAQFKDPYMMSMRRKVFQKLVPWKGIVRFGKRGKLNPHYIGSYEIIERIGPVAYSLDLPKEFSRVHDVFHISMLCKYISDPSHVLETPEFELRDDLSYEEQPVQILSKEEKKLCNKTIPLVKVLSRNHLVEQAT